MKIAIAGYGIEGKSSYAYYKALGHDVIVLDQRSVLDDLPEDATAKLGKDAFDNLSQYDMVIRTASLPPKRLASAKKVWSVTNEFFEKCPAPIIGVTGTKGKGTTSSLITSILREAGQTVHLVGNIGVPALDSLRNITSEDIVVYELSSFQLWDIEKSPTVAVVLMIESDHLDVHEDFDDYINAKANIRRFQTQDDICFYHPTNAFSRQIAETNSDNSTAHRYNDPTDSATYIDGENFVDDGCVICPISAVQLPGVFNLENACAAISAALEFTDDWAAVERGIKAFKGLDHRLKFVREVRGVSYYDDSIATTPGSAVAAIHSFDQPKIIILGGSTKGSSFDEVAEAAAIGNVKSALLIGDTANEIEEVLEAKNIATENLGSSITMQEVVARAQAVANKGDVVILSPACASFDMFKSYQDRGDQFIAAVESLGE